MTLTYELDLDILPLDLHTKIQVRMSIRVAGISRRTHRHTHDVKTITHAHHVIDVGCNNYMDGDSHHAPVD